MEYKRKLLAAAEFVLATDRRAQGGVDPDPTEFGVSAILKPHQVQGVGWLIRRYLAGVNVVLGDEMGLGKTLQAISLLSYLKMKLLSGPFLVLCPLSVTDCWISEFDKFCPDLQVLRYVGDKRVRRDMRGMLFEHVQKKSLISDGQLGLPFDVLLTTYDIALLDQDFLSQIPWHFCVIDEAQRLKNPSSVLYNVLDQQYILPRRLLVTGTPIQNNLSELWALMHFCLPSIFGTLEQFLSAFGGNDTFFSDHIVNDGKGQFKLLKHILRAFMLRRTKYMLIESGALVLPLLTELTIIVPLAPLQKKVYVSILRKELQQLLAFSSGLSNQQSLQNIVIQLRKACSHPYLFNGIEPEPFEEGEHLVQASGKLIILDVLLQKLHILGHRVLLFAQLTHTLDILQDYLELRKYTYERLDGSVRAEERFAAIRSFSVETSEDQQNPFIFLISTRAGGVGLNLVAADTVIFFEQDWNPQVDKQALQRSHRIGQSNNVLVINLVTGRTIEEVIKQRAERKLQLSNEVVGEVGDDFREGKVINGDIRSLIFGLRVFDPADISDNNSSELNINKLDKMADKVVRMHNPDQNNQKVEVDYLDLHNEDYMYSKGMPNTISLDPEVDEAAYQSWVEKFKVASQSLGTSILDTGKRIGYFDNEPRKHESKEKRLEEQRLAKEQKRLAKWEALGYRSMAVKRPGLISRGDSDILSDSGCVQYVYGDCTKPSKFFPSEPKIIFSCVDNSGNWGKGGMFDALANISDCVVDAYHRASEFGDLHLGDLHLIRINESSHDEHTVAINGEWVALAVVQSYNLRRKIPRSNISIEDLEVCLSKACFVAAQNSASLRMPRIGYQSGSQCLEWYAMERLLRKYSSLYGVKIFVYYFRRTSGD